VTALWHLGKGWWYKITLPMRGVRFSAGRNLRVMGRLSVNGPGRVVFGDDVVIGMRVTPWTHTPEAEIRVGNRVFLNGTRFGCARSITLGDRVIVGESHVMDTDFHSIQANRWDADAPVRVKPVVLEQNVWVGAAAGILPGTHIGADSVVGFGAVCSGSYPSGVIIAGNPAKVVRPIPGASSPTPD
jgi:acetyltransferase-like isoleucine patch superfamily enzyme